MATQRLKTKAAVYASQSRDDVAAEIRAIGDLTRSQARLQADMNDAVAAITAQYQPQLDALKERISGLQEGVQIWCEANRHELTREGRQKSHQFVTGEVMWRQRPPSVSVRGVDAVVDALQRLGLGRFLRTKTEINKEAILNEPEAVRGVAGITLQVGVEDFVITPLEVDAS